MWWGLGNATIGVPFFNSGNYQGAQLFTAPIELQFPLPGAAYSEEAILAFQNRQLCRGFTLKSYYHLWASTFFGGWWYDYSND